MPYDALLAAYPSERSSEPPDGTRPPEAVAAVVAALGGVSLAGGLYRVFRAAETREWTAVAQQAFPDVAERITVFGADWLGGLFAADSARLDGDGMPMVLALEPSTGEVLQLPVSVDGLHSSELLEQPDAAVALSFYETWRRASGDLRPLAGTECVGYRVPLFLGGADEVVNLERTDMDVYWSAFAQLHRQTRGLPAGTPVCAVEPQAPKRRLFRRGG